MPRLFCRFPKEHCKASHASISFPWLKWTSPRLKSVLAMWTFKLSCRDRSCPYNLVGPSAASFLLPLDLLCPDRGSRGCSEWPKLKDDLPRLSSALGCHLPQCPFHVNKSFSVYHRHSQDYANSPSKPRGLSPKISYRPITL